MQGSANAGCDAHPGNAETSGWTMACGAPAVDAALPWPVGWLRTFAALATRRLALTIRLSSPAPFPLTLRDGSALVVRPLAASDAAALTAFMAALPEVDRFFMKDDVTDPGTAAGWAQNSDKGRSLALLAFDGDRVVADGALVRHRGGFRSHHAEVRVSILPGYRGKGLGTALVRKLAEVAWEADLQFLDFELVAGPQDAAIEAMRSIGAYEVGTLAGFVWDVDGQPRDLVFLRLPLGHWFAY